MRKTEEFSLITSRDSIVMKKAEDDPEDDVEESIFDGQKEIESAEVIRVLLQFLKENSLFETFDSLVKETNIHLNTIENPSLLSAAILDGQWDVVMREVATVELSDAVQADLFEQIVLEMAEQRELDTCRKLLKTRPIRLLQANHPERFTRLDGIVHRGQVEEHEWPMGSKKKNRKVLSKTVVAELALVPPSRLLTIIGQALKWQRHMGHLPPSMAFSLFRDKAPEPNRADEQPPTLGLAPIVFAKGCRPVCAAFSPDGRSLATGSTDGFLEVWNWMRAELRTDLVYQAKDELMMHECDVVCLAWSKDSELLASGDAKGGVKLWQVSSGKCVRRFKSAHERGITDIGWSSDCAKIITSSLDGTVRMHGLRSGKTIKFFRGHSSFVNRCIYVSTGLASCAMDGTIRLWDKKSGDLQKTFSISELEEKSTGAPAPVTATLGILDMVNGRDREGVIVCNRTATVYRIGFGGDIIMRYVCSEDQAEILSVAVSSLGKFIYAATSSSLFVFHYETGAEEIKLPLPDDTLRIFVHPHMNVLCVLSMDQKAMLYRAPERE